jgi:hypothetical protein
MRHVRRAGRYYRVADPDWEHPLTGDYARERGGRWNAPGTVPVVYLNRDVVTARAYVRHKYAGLPYGPELLRDERGPVLVSTEVPDDDYVDAVSDAGRVDLGLPASYPRDESGKVVSWVVCQPIGQRAWEAGERGIACRSAQPDGVEELAYFSRARALLIIDRVPFGQWFWPARPGDGGGSSR